MSSYYHHLLCPAHTDIIYRCCLRKLQTKKSQAWKVHDLINASIGILSIIVGAKQSQMAWKQSSKKVCSTDILLKCFSVLLRPGVVWRVTEHNRYNTVEMTMFYEYSDSWLTFLKRHWSTKHHAMLFHIIHHVRLRISFLSRTETVYVRQCYRLD